MGAAESVCANVYSIGSSNVSTISKRHSQSQSPVPASASKSASDSDSASASGHCHIPRANRSDRKVTMLPGDELLHTKAIFVNPSSNWVGGTVIVGERSIYTVKGDLRVLHSEIAMSRNQRDSIGCKPGSLVSIRPIILDGVVDEVDLLCEPLDGGEMIHRHGALAHHWTRAALAHDFIIQQGQTMIVGRFMYTIAEATFKTTTLSKSNNTVPSATPSAGRLGSLSRVRVQGTKGCIVAHSEAQKYKQMVFGRSVGLEQIKVKPKAGVGLENWLRVSRNVEKCAWVFDHPSNVPFYLFMEKDTMRIYATPIQMSFTNEDAKISVYHLNKRVHLPDQRPNHFRCDGKLLETPFYSCSIVMDEPLQNTDTSPSSAWMVREAKLPIDALLPFLLIGGVCEIVSDFVLDFPRLRFVNVDAIVQTSELVSFRNALFLYHTHRAKIATPSPSDMKLESTIPDEKEDAILCDSVLSEASAFQSFLSKGLDELRNAAILAEQKWLESISFEAMPLYDQKKVSQ